MQFSSRTAVPCSRRLQPQRHGLNAQGKPKYFFNSDKGLTTYYSRAVESKVGILTATIMIPA